MHMTDNLIDPISETILYLTINLWNHKTSEGIALLPHKSYITGKVDWPAINRSVSGVPLICRQTSCQTQRNRGRGNGNHRNRKHDNTTIGNIHRQIGTKNIEIAATNAAIEEEQNEAVCSAKWFVGLELVLDYATMTEVLRTVGIITTSCNETQNKMDDRIPKLFLLTENMIVTVK